MKKNIVLACISILITVGLLEVVLRIVGLESSCKIDKVKQDSEWALVPERIWTEPHPILGWYHEKNKHAVLKLAKGDVELNTNSAGFRGKREYEKIKPATGGRIAAVGDSFFFGWGVLDDQTFAARLEAKYKNLEVINFSVPGYGLDQFLIMYRTVARDYHPDYVLIGIFPEDFWRATRSFADTGHAKPYFSLTARGELNLHNVPVPPKFALRTNQFPEVIERSPLEHLLLQSVVYRMVKRGAVRLGKNLGLLDPDTEDEWILGKAILHTMISEIKRDGAHPVLIILPPDRWIRDKKPDALRKSLLRFAQNQKVDCLDMTPIFYEATQKAKLTDYYIEGDWHWTARGQQLAADLIDDYLLKQGLRLEK